VKRALSTASRPICSIITTPPLRSVVRPAPRSPYWWRSRSRTVECSFVRDPF
jgi:hypothetical protein